MLPIRDQTDGSALPKALKKQPSLKSRFLDFLLHAAKRKNNLFPGKGAGIEMLNVNENQSTQGNSTPTRNTSTSSKPDKMSGEDSAELKQELRDFLKALGYEYGSVYIRLLPPKGFEPEHYDQFPDLTYEKDGKRIPGKLKLRMVGDEIYWITRKGEIPMGDAFEFLQNKNAQGFGVYFVVNPGGHHSADIEGSRVLFWEDDNKSKADQLATFDEFNEKVGGGLATETSESMHCYTVHDEFHDPLDFGVHQLRAVAHFDSDFSIWDACRLMRLPTFDHTKMVDGAIARFLVRVVRPWDGEKASWWAIDNALPPATEEMIEQAMGFHSSSSVEIPPGDNPCDARNFVKLLPSYGSHTKDWDSAAIPAIGVTANDGFQVNLLSGKYKVRSGTVSPVQALKAIVAYLHPKDERITMQGILDWIRGERDESGDEDIGDRHNLSEEWSAKDNLIQMPIGRKTEASSNIQEAIDQLAALPSDQRDAALISESQKLNVSAGYLAKAVEGKAATADIETAIDEALAPYQKFAEISHKRFSLGDYFPDELAEQLTAKAASLGVHASFMLQYFLAGVSTAIGNKIDVHLKDQWYVNAIIWLLIVAPSGAGKTRPLNCCLGYFEEKQLEANQKYKADQQKYKRALAEAARSGQNNDSDEIEEPPVKSKYVYQVATMEALLRKQSLQPKGSGAVLVRDEFAGFLNSLGQYKGGKGDDEEIILQLWDGKSFDIERVQDGADFSLEDPRINFVGGMQPSVAEGMFKGTRKLSGSLARFRMTIPPQTSRDFYVQDIDISPYVNHIYRAIESFPIQTVELSRAAYHLYGDHYGICRDSDDSPAMATIRAKSDDYIPRFALILHAIECAVDRDKDLTILSSSTMARAIALEDYFLSQSKLFLSEGDSEGDSVDNYTSAMRNVQQAALVSGCRGLTFREAGRVAGVRSLAREAKVNERKMAEKIIGALVQAGDGEISDKGKAPKYVAIASVVGFDPEPKKPFERDGTAAVQATVAYVNPISAEPPVIMESDGFSVGDRVECIVPEGYDEEMRREIIEGKKLPIGDMGFVAAFKSLQIPGFDAPSTIAIFDSDSGTSWEFFTNALGKVEVSVPATSNPPIRIGESAEIVRGKRKGAVAEIKEVTTRGNGQVTCRLSQSYEENPDLAFDEWFPLDDFRVLDLLERQSAF